MNYYINDLKRILIKKYPNLQRYIRYNYGIDLSKISEETKDTHYIFGVSSEVAKKKIMLGGDWTKVAEQIEKEKQSSPYIESMNCTVYGFLNVVEMIMLHKFGLTVNFSDRWLGIKAGTTRNGNVPTKVVDTARKVGLLPQELLPNNIDKFNWNEYYSYKDSKFTEEELDKEALKFLDEYTIRYETVYPSIVAMNAALEYGPLYVAGSAWALKNGEYYTFADANHCFSSIFTNTLNSKKKALDSYDPFIKILGSNFTVCWPKLIIINRKGQEYNVPLLKQLIQKGVKFLFRAEARGEIYKVEQTGIVKLEPQDWLNLNVEEKARSKELLPINEDYFNNKILL